MEGNLRAEKLDSMARALAVLCLSTGVYWTLLWIDRISVIAELSSAARTTHPLGQYLATGFLAAGPLGYVPALISGTVLLVALMRRDRRAIPLGQLLCGLQLLGPLTYTLSSTTFVRGPDRWVAAFDSLRGEFGPLLCGLLGPAIWVSTWVEDRRRTRDLGGCYDPIGRVGDARLMAVLVLYRAVALVTGLLLSWGGLLGIAGQDRFQDLRPLASLFAPTLLSAGLLLSISCIGLGCARPRAPVGLRVWLGLGLAGGLIGFVPELVYSLRQSYNPGLATLASIGRTWGSIVSTTLAVFALQRSACAST